MGKFASFVHHRAIATRCGKRLIFHGNGGQDLVFLVRIANADIPLALVGIIKAVNLPHINQCLGNALLLQQFGYFVGDIALRNAVERQAHAFLGKTDFFGIKIDFVKIH